MSEGQDEIFIYVLKGIGDRPYLSMHVMDTQKRICARLHRDDVLSEFVVQSLPLGDKDPDGIQLVCTLANNIDRAI